MAQKRNHLMRYVILAVTFCAVCLVYVGRLFYVQIITKEETKEDEASVRLVIVPAVRGEIFDRNGKALVVNRYTYDLVLSNAVLSNVSASEMNRICLNLLNALTTCDAESTHTERYFPFDGTYPNYSYSDDAQNENTSVSYHLRRILKAHGMKAGTSAKNFVAELVDTYRLRETDGAGNRLYTDRQIDRLLRLHYDMEAKKFPDGEDYTFATGTDTAFLTYVQEQSLAGVSFTVTAGRTYCYPGYASHILGTVGPIYSEEWDYYNERGYQMNATVGKSGCEAAFEEYLHGVDGKLKVTFDANGTVLSTETIVEPQSGQDVYLTVDIDLQITAEEALKQNVENVQNSAGGDFASKGYECNAGAAVAMNPDTFEILAIASHPTFDLTTYNRDYADLAADSATPLLNRALRGVYAPGSTFKVLMAAVGLNDGLITSSTRVTCTGSYPYGDIAPKCSTYPHAYGSALTVTQALADSCNSFFYDLGLKMGIDNISKHMKAFGVGEETGLELGEETGRRSERDSSWQAGNVLSTAIGQYNTQMTPLQIGVMISSVVNGGTRYQAHLLREVRAFGSDEPSYTDGDLTDSPLSRTELSQSAVNTVLRGMRDVVTGSVLRNYTNAGVKSTVGGKTGTAEVWKYLRDEETGEFIYDDEGNRERVTVTNALYAGVATAPGEDRPGLVVSVVLENAAHGYYASYTAARITAAWEK